MKTPGLSLRVKVSLALTSITVLSVLLVGFLAKMLVMEKFSDQAMERAFQNFSQDVTGFITQYGSWQAGTELEGFGNYVRRTRAFMHPPGLPQHLLAGPPPGINQDPPPPPFRFVLTDPSNMVIHGSEKYPVNLPLQKTLQERKMPIRVNGELVAYAVPLGQPNLSPLDLSYLEAVDRALLYAVTIVGLFSILLGILLGNRLSSPLLHLAEVISSVRPGEIRKDVSVSSKDEVAVLARAFNQMSHQLADAYEELEQAHEKVTEQAERLLELSSQDELTDLYNRRHFQNEATRLFKEARRHHKVLSVLLADIDFFKKINDQFGHAVGDEVLRHVAQILKRTLRETDLIARYGGEEFVVLFPETDREGAAMLSERLRVCIEQYDWKQINPQLNVTISMGLCSDKSLGSLDIMLIQADEQMYFAKKNGRNQLALA